MKPDLDDNIEQLFENSEFSLITESVGDVPLLIGMMIKMAMPEILDKCIPSRWNQRNLSWGWTITVWLAYILSEGDHRKVSVEAYVAKMQNTLCALTGQVIEPLDFSDDRLSHALTHLSKNENWHEIENLLNQRSIEVYELPKETVRFDATTVSGQHTVTDDGIMQFGHSKDDPHCPQVKLMTAALDPLGMPLATDTVSGENADDSLYIPIIERIAASLDTAELLFVGDCKMSALAIRVYIAAHHHFYLSPLPLTGKTASSMEAWITQGIEKDKLGELVDIFRENEQGETILIARGYELERELIVNDEDGNAVVHKERVLVIHSPNYALQQARCLDQRIENAIKKIASLTPGEGRGKRQITQEDDLVDAINKILKAHRVSDVLEVDYEKQVKQQVKYVGRGRGSANRECQTVEKIRYQITAIRRCEDKIAEKKQRFGWKAFVTNAPKKRLSLEDAVLNYRNEYRVERIFRRLKSYLDIAPLFVTRNDQIKGMTYLLMLGVRVLTLIEFVVRRSLQEDAAGLPGLHPENKKKITRKPTAERLLKAFSGIVLTIVKNTTNHQSAKHLTSLSILQLEILQRLSLDIDIYQQLII